VTGGLLDVVEGPTCAEVIELGLGLIDRLVGLFERDLGARLLDVFDRLGVDASAELGLELVQRRHGSSEGDLVGGLLNVVQALGVADARQSFLQLAQRRHGLSRTLLEHLVLEAHRDDAFIDGCHYLVTSFHMSLTIWSNMGFRAGLMKSTP
jgi:hypothetical protein